MVDRHPLIVNPTASQIQELPSGDSLNGITIPDLRDKFIVGANAVTGSDSTYPGVSMNQTGGNADATLVSHSHTTNTTIEDDSNSTKSLSGTIRKISEGFNANGTASGVFTKTDDGNNNITGSSSTSPVSGVDFDGEHRHGTDTQGSAATNKNLPPFFALAFIIRTS